MHGYTHDMHHKQQASFILYHRLVVWVTPTLERLPVTNVTPVQQAAALRV